MLTSAMERRYQEVGFPFGEAKSMRLEIMILFLGLILSGGANGAPSGDAAATARAIAEIEKVGGVVEYDEENPENGVAVVRFVKARVTDSVLVHLRAFPLLLLLELKDAPVSDAAITNLRPLKRLESLTISHTRITDTGLECLESLTELKELC